MKTTAQDTTHIFYMHIINLSVTPCALCGKIRIRYVYSHMHSGFSLNLSLLYYEDAVLDAVKH